MSSPRRLPTKTPSSKGRKQPRSTPNSKLRVRSSKNVKKMPKELILQCIDTKSDRNFSDSDSDTDSQFGENSGWSKVKLNSNSVDTDKSELTDSSNDARITSSVGIKDITCSEFEEPIDCSTEEEDDDLNLETIENFRGMFDDDNAFVNDVIRIDPKVEPKQERKLIKKMVTSIHAKSRTSANSPTKARVSPPPGRHRVKVYDKPILKHSQTKREHIVENSPYSCDYIDIDGTLNLGNKNFKAYITHAEYRLLKEFKPNLIELMPEPVKLHPPTEIAHDKKTSRKNPSKSIISVKVKSMESFTQTEIAESAEHDTQTKRVEFNLEDNSVQSYTVEDNGTENPDAENNMENYYTTSAGTTELQNIGETYIFPANLEDINDENVLKELALSSEAALKRCIRNAKRVIHLASTSKLMKDYLENTSEMEDSEIVQEFYNSTNVEDSLRILMSVFGHAYHRVFAHLKIVKTLDEVSQQKFYESSSETPFEVENVPETPINKSEELYREEIRVPKCNFIPGLPISKFRVQIRKNDGFLTKTISFKNKDYITKFRSVDYISINGITSATREPYDSLPLTVPVLYDMQSRSISQISSRLTISKYHLNQAVDEIIKTIQEFLTGKYCKISNTQTKRISLKCKNKVKGINVYSGFLCQIANEFTNAAKLLRSGVLKVMQIDQNGFNSQIENIILSEGTDVKPTFIGSETDDLKYPVEGILPVKEAMRDVELGLQEIDSISKTASETLAHLEDGIKVKPKYLKVISSLLESIRQLELNRDVDFGGILMGVLVDTITLQNLDRLPVSQNAQTENPPGSPVLDRKTQMLYNFVKLYRSFSELVKYSKKLTLLSSFVASKSMDGIRHFSIAKNHGKSFEALDHKNDIGNIEAPKVENLLNPQSSMSIEINEGDRSKSKEGKKKTSICTTHKDMEKLEEKLILLSRQESNSSTFF